MSGDIKNLQEGHLNHVGSQYFESKPDDVFNAELAAQVIKRTDKLNDTTIELALRLKQAREFMAWSTSHIRSSWMEWQTESGKACGDLNLTRMAFERETKAIVSMAKDIKEFFNSEDYLRAHETLKESVALLDRFSQLKKDGTLDALADFILKVSCK